MSRAPRKKADSNIYHVIVRGINRQNIILSKKDYNKIRRIMEELKKKYAFEIYAYALMYNHFHFVIKDKDDNLSKIVQSMNISYSFYFNKKYERTGHLFENRFKSRIVETNTYLRNLVRYIHKNPEKAAREPYSGTSYTEYKTRPKIVETAYVLSLFGETPEESINAFEMFHQQEVIEEANDYELISQIEDEEAISQMKRISNEENLVKIQNYEAKKKSETIKKFLEIEGITKTQIARILGINRKLIYRILEKIKK